MQPEKLAKRERVEAGADWIETARDLEEQSRLGLLSMHEISSTDLLLLMTQRERHDFDRDERLAILITNHMGTLLSKMFGAK